MGRVNMCLEKWVRDLLFDKDHWTKDEYNKLIEYFEKYKGPVEGIQTQYIWGKYYLMKELGYLGTDIEIINERVKGEPKFNTYSDSKYWEVKTLKGRSLNFTIAQVNMPENTTVLIFNKSGNFLNRVYIFDLYKSDEYNITYTFQAVGFWPDVLKKAMSKNNCDNYKFTKDKFSTKNIDTAKVAYSCVYTKNGEHKIVKQYDYLSEEDEATKFEVTIELPIHILRMAQRCDIDLNELLYDFIRKLQSDYDLLKSVMGKRKEIDINSDIPHLKEEIKVELPSDLFEFVLHSEFDFDETLLYAIENYFKE